ncbi:MAG: hypothetical protein R2761_30135 [Acidimicrobiales bacterium]
MIDGATRLGRAETIEQLAAANGAAVATIRSERGEGLALWLTFEAGWYEGSPLHFDIVATTPLLDHAARARMAASADVVILVVETSPDGLAAASRHLLSEAGPPGDAEPGLVVFARRTADEAEPEAVLAALGLPPATPALLCGPDGSGVRYGFALAVRVGLARVRQRDELGLPRRRPCDADGLRSICVGGGVAPPVDCPVAVPQPHQPEPEVTPIPLVVEPASSGPPVLVPTPPANRRSTGRNGVDESRLRASTLVQPGPTPVPPSPPAPAAARWPDAATGRPPSLAFDLERAAPPASAAVAPSSPTGVPSPVAPPWPTAAAPSSPTAVPSLSPNTGPPTVPGPDPELAGGEHGPFALTPRRPGPPTYLLWLGATVTSVMVLLLLLAAIG